MIKDYTESKERKIGQTNEDKRTTNGRMSILTFDLERRFFMEQQDLIDRLLDYMKEEAYKPLTVSELEEALGIKDSSEFKDFVKTLVYMEEKGISCPNKKRSLWFA